MNLKKVKYDDLTYKYDSKYLKYNIKYPYHDFRRYYTKKKDTRITPLPQQEMNVQQKSSTNLISMKRTDLTPRSHTR